MAGWHAALSMGRYISPLRYPGSKRQLVPVVVDILWRNRPLPATFVEPFAGGAAVSLYLASAGAVDRVVIGDADPLVAAFWEVCCSDPGWLADAVWDVTPDIAAFDAARTGRHRAVRDRALACLVQNRLAFGGILHKDAGPLGGRHGRGVTALDARWYPATLADRIHRVGKLAANGVIASVQRGDYRDTVASALAAHGTDGTFVYLDPPFAAKAPTLYRRSFGAGDHAALAEWAGTLPVPWLCSYDDDPDVARLHRRTGRRTFVVTLTNGYVGRPRPGDRRDATELLITTAKRMPAYAQRVTRAAGRTAPTSTATSNTTTSRRTTP